MDLLQTVEDVLVLRFADNTLPYTYTVSRKVFETYSGWVNAILAGHKEASTMDLPLALSYPVPQDVKDAQHEAWLVAHPFPPFVAAPAISNAEAFVSEHVDDAADGWPIGEAEEVAPNPYAIYAHTNAMTQDEADAVPASDFNWIMQEVSASILLKTMAHCV